MVSLPSVGPLPDVFTFDGLSPPTVDNLRTWTVCFLHALGPVEMVNKCWLNEPVHLRVQDPAFRSL